MRALVSCASAAKWPCHPSYRPSGTVAELSMNATDLMRTKQSGSTSKPKFVWDDPLLLNEQLAEDERMVRDAAHAYAQDKLLPRVTDAFRHERSDPAIFPRNGRAGPARRDASGRVRRRRAELRLLWTDRARDRARRLGLPLDDERAEFAGDVSDLRLRLRCAAQEIPADARQRRIDRLLRPDRAEPRLGSGLDDRRAPNPRPAATSCRAPRCGFRIRRSPTCSSSGPRPTTASFAASSSTRA